MLIIAFVKIILSSSTKVYNPTYWIRIQPFYDYVISNLIKQLDISEGRLEINLLTRLDYIFWTV